MESKPEEKNEIKEEKNLIEDKKEKTKTKKDQESNKEKDIVESFIGKSYTQIGNELLLFSLNQVYQFLRY